MKFKEFLHIYTIGAIAYMFIEILWRGYTHWSMGIVGGICFTLIYSYENHITKINLFQKALLSAFSITLIEFLTGLFVNRILNLNVWDYSTMKFNLMGQISLIYSILWYFLCIPSHLLSRILKHRVFGVLAKTSQS